jgi:hypothetical protein
MSNERFAFGDRVRHATRPEWGVGSVVKTEELPINGKVSQRVSVRFPGVGVKRLSAAHAELERVTDEASENTGADEAHPVEVWGGIEKSDWLAPVAQRKIDEAMITLPRKATDPFIDVRERIRFTLTLFRFDRTGRALIDWAVAQTGLDDPMTRFNRHELEQFFDRWAFERDAHLGRLLQEAGGAQFHLEELLEKAPPPARKAVRRIASVR